MTKDEIRRTVLACPKCQGPVRETVESATCTGCGYACPKLDDILMIQQEPRESYFDARYETMDAGNREPGVWSFCYEKQVDYLRRVAKEGAVVVDVGCGPAPVYGAQSGWYLIGVDPSLQSLRANSHLDLKIFGTAEQMPLAQACADVVTCFYSVHHMVGDRVVDAEKNVAAALKEFRRILRPGGSILVFDMSPWWPAWLAQKATWNLARKVLGGKLDMFFWHWRALQALADGPLSDTELDLCSFDAAWNTTFPPVFSAPWLRLPRILYPMQPRLYHWRTRSAMSGEAE
jgi:SAM-dependent methyltransferase